MNDKNLNKPNMNILTFQMKELREKAEKHVFQAEVNRMMKLIINSLYRNKEVNTYNNSCSSNNFRSSKDIGNINR